MHVGYAAIVGASLVRDGRRPALRAVGSYPVLVVLVIVATGNHFLFDAAAGLTVAAAAAGAARLLLSPRTSSVSRTRKDLSAVRPCPAAAGAAGRHPEPAGDRPAALLGGDRPLRKAAGGRPLLLGSAGPR